MHQGTSMPVGVRCAAARRQLATTPAFAQQTTGTIAGRVLDEQKAAVPGATITAKNDSPPASRAAKSATRRALPDHRPAGRQLRAVDRDVGLPAAEARGHGQRVGDGDRRTSIARIATVAENVTVTAETPLVDTTSSAVGGVVDTRRVENLPLNGRQFANLAVTIPGRRPRLPRRSDQEHAVLAADQRRQRPQRQLPDRRRRQQRRHRRRPAAAVPARGDPGVQLPDLALQGRVRPQQRRRHEHRHQERHQRLPRQLLRAVPRQVDERADRDREARRHRQAGLPPQPVRRQRRRPDRRRTARTSSPRSSARNQDTTQAVTTQGPVTRRRTASSRRRIARRCSPARRPPTSTPRQYLTVRYGRNQNSQPYGAAPQRDPRQLGRQQEQVQLDQREPQRVARRDRS